MSLNFSSRENNVVSILGRGFQTDEGQDVDCQWATWIYQR